MPLLQAIYNSRVARKAQSEKDDDEFEHIELPVPSEGLSIAVELAFVFLKEGLALQKNQ